jgi:DNA mismatch repair ATPase MutS
LKQTLVNASRYVTQELIDFEKDISSSEAKLALREHELFGEIRSSVLE